MSCLTRNAKPPKASKPKSGKGYKKDFGGKKPEWRMIGGRPIPFIDGKPVGGGMGGAPKSAKPGKVGGKKSKEVGAVATPKPGIPASEPKKSKNVPASKAGAALSAMKKKGEKGKGIDPPDDFKPDHMKHLLNGAKVEKIEMSKKAALDMAKEMRANGTFATVIKDPKALGKNAYMVTSPSKSDGSGTAGGPSGGAQPPKGAQAAVEKAKEWNDKGTVNDMKTANPPDVFNPNVNDKDPKTGCTKAARVGVPAHIVPPPPGIGRLPNLTPHERQVEKDFADAFESNPNKMASDFLDIVKRTTKPGEPLTFGTDDAKVLSSKWSDPNMSLEERSQNRATLNLALHQTANAITKKAFVQHLDSLQEGDEIMVTVGGCGAGKGYALKNVPQAGEVKARAKAVWDSAGDQNATENPWIQEEAEKRGLKVNYVYVHADPYNQWAHPERGVVKRAQDPNDGRMVDAHVFADSYAIGARNHKAFHEKNKDNPNATFTFLENGNPPKLLDKIPDSAFVDSNYLREFALGTVAQLDNVPAHVKRGATMGVRVWGGKVETSTNNQEAKMTKPCPVKNALTKNNCGIGSSGFEPGNKCAAGGGGGSSVPTKLREKTFKTLSEAIDLKIKLRDKGLEPESDKWNGRHRVIWKEPLEKPKAEKKPKTPKPKAKVAKFNEGDIVEFNHPIHGRIVGALHVQETIGKGKSKSTRYGIQHMSTPNARENQGEIDYSYVSDRGDVKILHPHDGGYALGKVHKLSQDRMKAVDEYRNYHETHR